MYAYGTNEGIIHIKIIQVNPYNKTIQKWLNMAMLQKKT